VLNNFWLLIKQLPKSSIILLNQLARDITLNPEKYISPVAEESQIQ
jgi:hypothetical protein